MIDPILGKHYKIIDMGYTSLCYVWIKSCDSKGYAQAFHDFFGKKTVVRVHKFLWEKKYGQTPDGKILDHLCNTRNCINIEHLEPVTHGENLHRGFIRGTKKPSGACVGKFNNIYCANGHKYTKENTYMFRGYRQCKICRKVRNAKRYLR
jgi:hypothetical protein